MASIRDVAKQAGVSIGTVSRFLNNSGYVSEESMAKIGEAMKQLDYIPNELARNLYHKRTGIIAVLVPNVSHPFFAKFVDCVEAELYKCGFKMMLCNTVKESNAELEYLDMLRRHIVDGVITGVHSLDVEEYKKIKKPIVALDRYLGEDIPVVTVDHKTGGRLAAEALIKNGCKRVLHFKGETKVASPFHERHYEFDRVMKKNHVQTISYKLKRNLFDTEDYRKAIQDAFSKGIEFDGVFGGDGLAIECMNEMIRRHKRVPEDVKFISYDGTFITEIIEPKMTTVVQPIDELASESVRLIQKMIGGKVYKNKNVVLDVKLRKGNTTIL